MEIFRLKEVYDFMSKRKPFLALSGVLFLISLGLLFFKGLQFGIDFSGGTLIQIKYEKNAPIPEIRKILLDNNNFSKANVSKFGSESEIVIKVPIASSSLEQDIGDTVRKLLSTTGNFEIRRVDIVGPKVGDALKEKGLIAFILAILVILGYLSYRFEWRFAVASILALIHDVTISIGAIILFNVDVNLDILAAILTILGYSLNDTIIVFDRIREGINTSKETDLDNVINSSVSNTLSRTTLTSLTTFFVVLTLFLFGGEIINGFSLTLLVGVIVGTYSSIFIAASFLSKLNFSISNYRAVIAEKEKRQKDKERLRAQFEKGSV